MSKRSIYRAAFIALLTVFTVPLLAQVQIQVRLTADRNRILIGEPIRLTLEADIPETQAIRFFQVDSLPHFEFLSREKIDTTNTGSGTILKQIVYVTSFDSGHWVIPPIPLTEAIATDSIAVDVVFSEFNPQQPYHDVKDIIEVKAPEKKENTVVVVCCRRWTGVVAVVILPVKKKEKTSSGGRSCTH